MKELEKLENAIEEYMAVTFKRDYEFTVEEQLRVQRVLSRLYNHVDMLIEYEVRKRGK